MQDKLILKNMSFYAFHGDDKSEQELGQRYEVDVAIQVDAGRAAQSDNLRDAINYKSIFQLVEKYVTERRYNLIETLATKIANAILDQFATNEVSVSIRKLKPPIHGILDYFEATVNRCKDSC